MEEKELHKGQLVYWVRRSTETVEEVKVHNVTDEYFTCIEIKGHRTFIFSWKSLDTVIFVDPAVASEMLEIAKSEWKEDERKPVKGSVSYALLGLKDTDDD